jgi:hypothetical protein
MGSGQTKESLSGRLEEERDDLRCMRAGARSATFLADGGVGGLLMCISCSAWVVVVVVAVAAAAAWRLAKGLACSSRGEGAAEGVLLD